METKKIIVVIILAILVLALIGVGTYYLINHNFNFATTVINQVTNGIKNEKSEPPIKIKQLTPEEIAAQNKKSFAETITGTISFLSKGSLVKATIKTSDGKEYTLSPDQPEAIYGSFGVKNGNRVQIQGKIIGDKIEWVNMKAI